MSCGIYKIVNIINNKVYIGQSVNILTRWRRHRTDSKNLNNCHPLYIAIRKYGLENFLFEIIEECPKSELNSREKYWIKKYDTFNSGYNQTRGGTGGTGSIKLSATDILEIIDLLKTTSLTNKEIANEYNVSENTICGINTGYYWYNDDIEYPIRKLHKNYCQRCGKIIKPNRKYCKDCLNVVRRIYERPTRQELKDMIRSIPFTTIANNFGVTDNAIRKWCDGYNLPRVKREIKKYSDEEWEKI